MINHVYGYARVSSRDQNSIRQIDAIRSAGVLDENIYSDHASGKNFERAEYQMLKARLQKGDLLIIKSIDRLGRNYNEIIAEWKTLTKDLQVNIKVIDLPLLDTTVSGKDLTGTFISDIVLQILSYVAEQERCNIKQRQAEGIALAKERGVRFGRPRIVKPLSFDAVYDRWKNKEITFEQAMKMTGLKQTMFIKFAAVRKRG